MPAWVISQALRVTYTGLADIYADIYAGVAGLSSVGSGSQASGGGVQSVLTLVALAIGVA